MLSPSILLSKIIGVLARNGGGENGTIVVVVGSMSLLNMALVCIRVGLGTSHLVASLCFHGFGKSLLTSHLFIASSPWPLIRWCQILPSPLSCRLYVQEKLASANINLPLILIRSWFTTKTSCSSVSCWWCGKHYGPPSIKVTSCRLQLIIQEVGLETLYGTLEPACLNGRFVAFDARFSSLASDRVILWVFDANSSIHTP